MKVAILDGGRVFNCPQEIHITAAVPRLHRASIVCIVCIN